MNLGDSNMSGQMRKTHQSIKLFSSLEDDNRYVVKE
jgi:hypothetical protein